MIARRVMQDDKRDFQNFVIPRSDAADFTDLSCETRMKLTWRNMRAKYQRHFAGWTIVSTSALSSAFQWRHIETNGPAWSRRVFVRRAGKWLFVSVTRFVLVEIKGGDRLDYNVYDFAAGRHCFSWWTTGEARQKARRENVGVKKAPVYTRDKRLHFVEKL